MWFVDLTYVALARLPSNHTETGENENVRSYDLIQIMATVNVQAGHKPPV